MERLRSWTTLLPRLGAALAVILSGALLRPIPSQAAARPSPVVTQLYLTTDQAYAAFDPLHAVAPPDVNHFAPAVEYLAAYFSFAGAQAGKTSFRVDFITGGKTVRRGESHRLTTTAGRYLLDVPGVGLHAPGKYLAVIYLGTRRAAATVFWLVRPPAVRVAYLITAAAWSRFHPTKPARPAHAGTIKRGTKQLAVYLEYAGAAHGATIAVVIYDRYGRYSASSGTHPLPRLPNGSDALPLTAASGAFPAGLYRADVYLDGVLAASLPWRAR
ncbi:MAG TPA: hypothetical protein VNL71_15940 [Chloroflexota bacterium]|nr:hypothetical protein [Chloroflexota bacterium]